MSSTRGSADWFLASLLSLISSMSSDVLLMFSSSCLFRNQMKTNRPVSFPTQIDWLHSATRRIRLQRPNLIFESRYELLEDSSADWLRQMPVKIKHKKTRIPQTVTYSLNQGSWRGNETGVCVSHPTRALLLKKSTGTNVLFPPLSIQDVMFPFCSFLNGPKAKFN